MRRDFASKLVLGALRVALLGLLGVAVLLCLGLYSLRFSSVQAFVLPRANAALSGLFRGRIEVERLGRATFDGVRGLDARLLDPAGKTLIEVRGADVSVFWPRILWQTLVTRPKRSQIVLFRVAIDHVHARVFQDETGELTLVRAFEPKARKAPTSNAKAAGDTETLVRIRAFEVRHASVDGKLGALAVDGELTHAQGALEVAPERFELDATSSIELRGVPGNVDPKGHLAFKLGIPSAKAPRGAPPILAQADFRGALARAESHVRVLLRDKSVEASLEAPRVGVESLAALLPAVTPRNPLALRARVTGALSKLDFTLNAENADGRVAAEGTLQASEDTALTVRLRANAVDLSGFVAALPKTALGLEADARLRAPPGGPISGDYQVRSRGLAIAGVSYPPLRASGTFDFAASEGFGANGKLEIDEPGVRVQVHHDLRRLGTEAAKLILSARVGIANPPRFAKFFSGRGELSVEGTIGPGRSGDRAPATLGRVEARAWGKLERVRSSGLTLARLELSGNAAGPLENPRLSARLSGSEVRLFERQLDRFAVTLEGARDNVAIAAHVDAEKPARVDLFARATLAPELALRNLRVDVRDGPEFRLELRAERALFGAKERALHGLVLTGAGSARASFVATDRLRELELSTNALALSEILRHVGLGQRFSLDRVDLEARYADSAPSGPIGTLSGALNGIQLEGVDGGRVRVDLAFSDRRATGTLEAAINGAGSLFLMAEELRIPERFAEGLPAEKLDGALRATGHFELAPLEPLLTRFLPVSSTSGSVDLDARLERARESQLVVRLSSRGLRLTGHGMNESSDKATAAAERANPWHLDELSLDAEGRLDLTTWAARASVSVGDEHGAWLTAEASATPRGVPGSRAFFLEAPLNVRVLMPPRALDELPSQISPSALRGVAALDLELAGTLRDPRLRAHGVVNCLRSFTSRASVDLELDADYARTGGELKVAAQNDRKPLGKLDARWQGDLSKLASPLGPSPVRADLSLSFERFPVDVLPVAARRDLSGPLSGAVTLQGFGRDARLSVDLKSDALAIGPMAAQPFELSLSTGPRRVLGRLSLGRSTSHARVEFTSPLDWGNAVLPHLEPQLEGRFYAQNFELGTLLPWVAADVSELGGTINADLKARLSDNKPLVEGTLWIERGVVQVPAIGQRFSDISAKVTADGGAMRLESFEARGTSGRLDASGQAKLDGLTVTSAEGHMHIERDDKIPVTVQGAAVGYAWGSLHAKIETERKERETRVTVDVPELHVELPNSNPASLQDLTAAPAVRAGTRLPDGNFVALPIEPPSGAATRAPHTPGTTRVEVNLGRQVWIERGEQLDVQVGGKLLLTPGAQAPVQGTIDLREGTLDVRGKRFQIERGSVNFSGPDPSNPTITALARWDSPEGYAVIAEYSGTARHGKLSLRSEPTLTDNEILSLLLFGTPEGGIGAQPGLGTTAIGLASGSVIQSFNHVLSSLTNLDVSARIDTSTGTSRPEISVQLSPRLTARVTVAVGSPTVGQAPDRTFLTVDLRLRRAWSLSAMVGDRGASALDLLWRKRY